MGSARHLLLSLLSAKQLVQVTSVSEIAGAVVGVSWTPVAVAAVSKQLVQVSSVSGIAGPVVGVSWMPVAVAPVI